MSNKELIVNEESMDYETLSNLHYDSLFEVKSATGGYNTSAGFIPASWGWNWWQEGKDPTSIGRTAIVGACTDAYAQTTATLLPYHFALDDDGTKIPIDNSALARILHRPNGYQTSSDFRLNLVKSLLYTGNSYVLGLRNGRNEFETIHLLPSVGTMPYIDDETKSIFYAIGNNPLVGDIEGLIPARDIMHLRLYCPRHPLVGVSPLENAALSMSANASISAHQANFFNNMSRPSGVLSTEQKLNLEQMLQLREAWESQAKQMSSGGIPILSSGIKWEPMALSAIDAQIVEAFNMTINDVARAFRVPLPLVQQHNEASTYNNVEQLYSQWLSGGLGFLIEHIEQNFNYFFNLPRTQGTELDTESLLRTDFKGKVEGYSKGIQGGLFTPNEARKKFNRLKPLPNGDTAYMQAQMVPLGFKPEPVVEPEPEPVVEPEVVEDALFIQYGIETNEHMKSFV